VIARGKKSSLNGGEKTRNEFQGKKEQFRTQTEKGEKKHPQILEGVEKKRNGGRHVKRGGEKVLGEEKLEYKRGGKKKVWL